MTISALSRLASILFGCLAVFVPAPADGATTDVELMLDGKQLTPAKTLEVRFARDMVRPERFGVEANPSPVVLDPPLAGSFVWLSRRSGVFSPTAEPKMGSTYTLSLAPGVLDLAGQPIGASFKAVLQTPAFAVVAGLDSTRRRESVEPNHAEQIACNREVKLDGAEKLFRFVQSDGKTAAATVRYATGRDYFRVPPEAEAWETRWARARGQEKAAPPMDNYAEASDEPRRNLLIVEPATPLTPGAWRLEMQPGLSALTGGYAIHEAKTVNLGNVEPFAIAKVTTSSYLNSGRSIEVDWTHDPGPEMNEDSGAKFFAVTPEVKNLRVEMTGQGMALHGDFARGAEYRITISDALRDGHGIPLSGERSRTVRFGAVKPRVYLPAVTTHQMAGGLRQFPITTVNMKSLRVVAQLVAPGDAPRALQAFAKYQKDRTGEDDDHEIYQPVGAKALPGRVVFDRQIELPASQLDAAQETKLEWTEVLGGAPAGMIFLTVDGRPLPAVGGQRAGAQTLVQLTDLGVLWKKVDRQLQISVFSMGTGQPVSGAQVTLKNDQLQAVSGSVTDAGGAAQLPLTSGLAWLAIRHGNDAHTLAMGESASELPMAAFRLPIWYDRWWDDAWEGKKASPPKLRALLFTDRPLYHLGETAHLKGVVRTISAEGLAATAGQTGRILLELPHDRGVRSVPIKTDARGAFDVDLPLDAAAAGTYRARLAFASPGKESEEETPGEFFTTFVAGDYQPNAFEVQVALPKQLAPGQAVTAEVSGRYFFGAPLGAAHAKWTLQEADADLERADFPEFRFGSSASADQKSFTAHGEEALGARPTVAIRPRVPETESVPRQGRLTVEVTDENQQTVSETREYQRDSSSFYLGLRTSEGGVIGHAESIGARVIALRTDGTPLPEPLKVKAELIHIVYDVVRAQSAGPAISMQSSRREEIVETRDGQTLVPVRAGGEWALPPGETARFQPGHAGEYLLRVSARDDGGRLVVADTEFSVSGNEAIAWDYRNPAQVELVADKASYHPGETAKLLIKTPIAGEALISIERDTQILRTLHVTLVGNAPLIEIPLSAADAPNVFVSMVLIRGAAQSTHRVKQPEYRYGVCRLLVTNPATQLAVQLAPRVPKVQPGDDIFTEISVHGADGNAVAGAEVTFFAVDEGVLALTGYEAPKPHDIFEKPFELKIRTGLSLFDLLPEPDAPDAIAEGALGNKGYLIGGGGAGGPGPKLRSDFPGTAAWEPKLLTNAEGKASVHFRAPDALTSYRLVAFAHADADRFGTAESKVQISKKFLILSGLGQFAHNGDTLIARAVVRNESGQPGTAHVSLQLDANATAASGPLTQTLPLQAGEARTVDFPVKLVASGSARWQWSGELEVPGGKFSDALAVPLTITPPALLLRETYLPELRATGNDLLEGVNPQLLDGRGTVRVTLSNTRLAGLRDATDELLEYPYGCAEQTLSSMIPWIVARDFGPILPKLAEPATARRALEAGLGKLHTMQTERTGLAYWPGGREPSLFASAYGALVLAMLDRQPEGAARVTDAPLQKELLAFLSKALRGLGALDRRDSLEDDALALYALAFAGQPEPAYQEVLFNRRAELSHEGRALLAAALMESKGSAAAVAKLLDPQAPAEECTCWFGSATRERAIRLLAWLRFKRDDREVGRLVKELLAARINGHWRTTQENAWALLALSQYFAQIEHDVKPVAGTFLHADQATPFSLTAKALTHTDEFAFGKAALGPLQVTNPKKAPLYGEVKLTVEPPVASQPRQDRGFDLTRTYFKIGPDGSLGEGKDWQVGDRAVVLLEVRTSVPTHFVAIDDPLPAIFEAVNPEFRSQAVGGFEGADDYAADFREMRAERVLYFCDHLPPGTHRFCYLARVRAAGEVTAPATKAEEMYRPEHFGLGTSEILQAQPR